MGFEPTGHPSVPNGLQDKLEHRGDPPWSPTLFSLASSYHGVGPEYAKEPCVVFGFSRISLGAYELFTQ